MTEYVCGLDEKSLKVAKDELHEDPKNRMGAVQSLKQWIEEQPHLNFTTDTSILIMFLRYAKFSQLKVRTVIENHCQNMSTSPSWYSKYDPRSASFIELAKSGFIFPLPGYDSLGRKFIVYRVAAYNPNDWKHRKDELINAMFGLFYHLMKDERTQVNGIVYLNDMSGMTIGHQTLWTMDELKKMMKSWQSTTPARFKAFYHYNCGPIWEAMMAMISPFMTKKFRDRIVVIGNNLEKVYKVFPMEKLPVEYLPDDYTGPTAGSFKSMSEAMLEDMQTPESLDFFAKISDPRWKYDASKKLSDVPQASFRKLDLG